MYERLEKLRLELERAKKRKMDAELRVKVAEEKLKEAENTQVLSDIHALKLTPEQVAEFLKLVSSGRLPMNGTNTKWKDENLEKSERRAEEEIVEKEEYNYEEDRI